MLDLDVFCPRKFFVDEVLLYLVVYVDKQTDEYDDSEESQRIPENKAFSPVHRQSTDESCFRQKFQ